MKKVIFFLFASILIFSCSDESTVTESNTTLDVDNYSVADMTKLVNDYNKTNTTNHKATLLDGRISTYYDKGSEYNRLVVKLYSDKGLRLYQMQFSKDAPLVDMPSEISNGRILYLKDNLLVQDLDNSKNYHNVIETFENRLPKYDHSSSIGVRASIYTDIDE